MPPRINRIGSRAYRLFAGLPPIGNWADDQPSPGPEGYEF